jgi:hypothetical protein
MQKWKYFLKRQLTAAEQQFSQTIIYRLVTNWVLTLRTDIQDR